MHLPELHAERIPSGSPYPVLLCLPCGTPIAAIADLGPDYDAEAIADEIIRATRAWANLKRYYLEPVETPSTLWECN